jgi:pantothenate kinase type III
VVATGGYSTIIAKEARTVDIINPDLTLIGIKAIHDMNQV